VARIGKERAVSIDHVRSQTAAQLGWTGIEGALADQMRLTHLVYSGRRLSG
jgi:hypothetical protein